MKISVKVKTNARENKVEEKGAGEYLVSVTVSPVENKANEVVIKVLAKYFGKAPSLISIIKGHTGKQKIIEIS